MEQQNGERKKQMTASEHAQEQAQSLSLSQLAKEQRRKYDREYRIAHQEQLREYMREYRRTHREQYRRYTRDYWERKAAAAAAHQQADQEGGE